MSNPLAGWKVSDPLWRLSNLYSCKDRETGALVPFRPNIQQQRIYNAIYRDKKTRIVIPKARRVGVSTGVDIMLVDDISFNGGRQCSIVDMTQTDATLKLRDNCYTAFLSLPEIIRNRYEIRFNDSLLQLSLSGQSSDISSAIHAGKHARGGTNHKLHISEWGPIQAEDPSRSEEILTGAIPSAEHGLVVVETTWKGGRAGHLWNIVKGAMERTNEWEILFFPWYEDHSYAKSGSIEELEQWTIDYFAETKSKLPDTSFTLEQKLWYQSRRRDLGAFIFQEFPTTIDECFKAPIEGAIYASNIDQARVEGRVGIFPVDNSALVHTAWDIGAPMNIVTWYFQLVGREIRLIDIDLDLDLTPVQRVAHIYAKGYPLGEHFFPHDAPATESSGRSFLTEMTDAGLHNARVTPRTIDQWVEINYLRQIFPKLVFRLPHTDKGLDRLANYHTIVDSSRGHRTDFIVHDINSHTADALEQIAAAEMAGMISGGIRPHTSPRNRPRGFKPRVIMGLSTGRTRRRA